MNKTKEKNLENAFQGLYIYNVRLKLMLLLVLTSISVVVAARQKRESKIYTDLRMRPKQKNFESRFRVSKQKAKIQKIKLIESFGSKIKTSRI